jgi:hypothetical protein
MLSPLALLSSISQEEEECNGLDDKGPHRVQRATA